MCPAGGIASFCRDHLGHRFASTVPLGQITEAFVQSIGRFEHEHGIERVQFKKGPRKETIFKERLRRFKDQEGVVFIGVAQEKARVPRTVRKQWPDGANYPWITYSHAQVNHYYFYCLDRDFGPFFIKFCSYFPYPAKVCLNGHEYLKRQLAKRSVAFEALDNGLLSCADPALAQKIAEGLSAGKIEAMVRKWLGRLPHPFSRADRKAGYRYELSILQARESPDCDSGR